MRASGPLADTKVVNTGAIAVSGGGGVNLGAGAVYNFASGIISGQLYGIVGGGAGQSSDVVNYGVIAKSSTLGAASVFLEDGGLIINGSATATSALISSTKVVGALINAPNGGGVVLNFGQIVANTEAVDVIGANALIDNHGLIFDFQLNGGGQTEIGALLANGGIVYNSAGATVRGRNGVVGTGQAGQTTAILNLGSIEGSSTLTTSAGVVLTDGGVMVNGTGALVQGNFNNGNIGGVGVLISGGSQAAILNEGTIVGTTGINFYESAVLVNYGTISARVHGTTGTAINFDNTGSNVLKISPTSVIFGTVSALTGSINDLFLASGASTGTVSSFGTFGSGAKFVNFGTIGVDPGANWLMTVESSFSSTNVFAGPNPELIALGAAATLTVASTLTAGYGIKLVGTGTLAVGTNGASSIEVGNLGGAAVGRLTVDPSFTLSG